MSKRGRHRSTTPELDRSIRWLESLPMVKKVIFGFTENCRHKYAPGHIRCRADIDGGIKANGYSGNGVLDIFIRTDSPELVRILIDEKFHD